MQLTVSVKTNITNS